MINEVEIERMSVEEKLRVMEALWANLSRHEEDVPVPQWHQDVLAERERLVEQGKAQYIPWEEAKRQLARRTSRDS